VRDYRTYAIRRPVEGGAQDKAELVAVGQSGEQSLKRIESAGERASGRLKGLGRQAELLRKHRDICLSIPYRVERTFDGRSRVELGGGALSVPGARRDRSLAGGNLAAREAARRAAHGQRARGHEMPCTSGTPLTTCGSKTGWGTGYWAWTRNAPARPGRAWQ
jgi:hypothetical protein